MIFDVGFRGLASFNSTTVTLKYADHVAPPQKRPGRGVGSLLIKFLPGIVNTLQCYGKERKLKECIYKRVGSIAGGLSRAQAAGEAFSVANIAAISCTGKLPMQRPHLVRLSIT